MAADILKPTPEAAAFVSALGNHPLVLVGLSSSGKTTLGRLLARELHIAFVDSDEMIEKENGRDLAELNRCMSIAQFRAAEAQAVSRLLRQVSAPTIVALGGGAFDRSETRIVIERTGISLWLETEFDQIQAKIAARPERDFALRELQQKRREHHSIHFRADLRLDVANKKRRRVVSEIIGLAPRVARLIAERHRR